MYPKRDSKKKPEVPFYEMPGRRRSSAEIIRAAKAELTMVATKFPSSPYVRSASLRENAMESRPASSVSHLSFLSNSPRSRPLSSIRLKPLRAKSAGHQEPIRSLHLEPTVVKSALIHRKSGRKSHEDSLCDSSSFASEDTECESPAVANRDELLATETVSDRGDGAQTVEATVVESPSKIRKVSQSRSIHVDNLLIGVQDNSEESSIDEETVKLENFESAINKLIPTLEKLVNSGKKKNEHSGLELVSKLHLLIKSSSMLNRPFKTKFIVLKLLFRLLNSHFPTLSLHVSKLVLEMGIAEKNLSNVCKLLYKVCHEEKNIVEFLTCSVLAPFMESVKVIEVGENPLALRYSMSLICLLSAKDLLLDLLGVFNCHEVLLQHLIKLNAMEACERDDEISYIVIKIVTAIRYLNENEKVLEAILQNDTCSELLKVLSMYEDNVQIVVTTIRLLSKISDSGEGCEVILAHPATCEILGNLVSCHKSQLFIILQVTLIVGNLLSHDNEAAVKFYALPDFLKDLHSMLESFIQRQVEQKKDNFCQSKHYSTPVSNSNDEDLAIKIIRILANICVNQEVGSLLAEEEASVDCLFKILDLHRQQDRYEVDEILLCTLIVLNNITYFVKPDAENASLYTRVFEGVIPLLHETYPLEVRIESCNIAQNLTRLLHIRSFVFKNKLVPVFVSLFDQYEQEVSLSGFSIIMNLLLDKAARAPFYNEQGVTKLIHKLHLCLCRDWNTATLLCQILWNFCSAEDSNTQKPLSHLETQHLVKVLQYSMGANSVLKTDDEKVKDQWESLFCPVAEKLLHLLQSFAC